MDTDGSANRSEVMREALKNLRSAISDEHTGHKAETVKCFKSFDPTDEKKIFDLNKHLKAVRSENSDYESQTSKALDEFEERCMRSTKTVQGEPGEIDDHIDWVTGILETHGRAHKKSLANVAKVMCREALGDSEITDAKTLEIVKAHIAPFIEAKNLTPIAIRIAAEITSENRKMLGEAYSNLKAATAIVEGLHGALGNDEGEESRSVDDSTSPKPAPKKQRSRPTESPEDDELKNHLLGKEIVREIVTVAQRGLTELNKRPRP